MSNNTALNGFSLRHKQQQEESYADPPSIHLPSWSSAGVEFFIATCCTIKGNDHYIVCRFPTGPERIVPVRSMYT